MDGNDQVYQVVAARRTQFDNLLWQVPVLSLTAQAFLSSIALGDSSRLSRIIASLLSMATSFRSVQLIAKHRKGEIADAEWLKSYEESYFPDTRVHGAAFRQLRDESSTGGPFLNLLTRLSSFKVWTVGLTLFGLVALFVLSVAVFSPKWFA